MHTASSLNMRLLSVVITTMVHARFAPPDVWLALLRRHALRTLRVWTAAIILTLLAVVSPGTAQGNVAVDIAEELELAGVPGAQVEYAAPAAASASDLAVFAEDLTAITPTVTNLNLLSPDATDPLPVVTVAFGKVSVDPLPGTLHTPTLGSWYSTEDAEFPVWRLDIMEAVKHAMGRGVEAAGVAMEPQFPHRSGTGPDMYMAVPDTPFLSPEPLPQTMSTDEASETMTAALPVWALGAVQVTDFAGDQRRAALTLSVPPQYPIVNDVRELTSNLLVAQVDANASGANIGSIIVRMTDAATQSPLFTFAGDASWGQTFAWISPFVGPFMSIGPFGASGVASGATTGATNAAGNPTAFLFEEPDEDQGE